MKRVIKGILFAVVVAALSMSIFAADFVAGTTFAYPTENKTVEFAADTKFTESQQQQIADLLVYGETESTASTQSLCWLVGHDYVENYAAVTTHKVATSRPRCLKEYYCVTTCSKCDYKDTTLVSSEYVDCCK